MIVSWLIFLWTLIGEIIWSCLLQEAEKIYAEIDEHKSAIELRRRRIIERRREINALGDEYKNRLNLKNEVLP